MGPLLMAFGKIVPWDLLDRLGLWRIPKFFYGHNLWPLRGLRAHDKQNERKN